MMRRNGPEVPGSRRPQTPSPVRTFSYLLTIVASLLLAPHLEGQGRGEAPVADWRLLAGLDYTSGALSSELKALDGKRVRVPGYMVPLDDSATGVTEFILVPYYGACIHMPPPPPNQMVYVRMNGERRVDVQLWDPIWIEGDLKVTEIDSPYGAIGHQLVGIRVSPYTL